MNSRPQAIKLLSPDDVIRINRKLGECEQVVLPFMIKAGWRAPYLLPSTQVFTHLQTVELLRLLDFGFTDTSQKQNRVRIPEHFYVGFIRSAARSEIAKIKTTRVIEFHPAKGVLRPRVLQFDRNVESGKSNIFWTSGIPARRVRGS